MGWITAAQFFVAGMAVGVFVFWMYLEIQRMRSHESAECNLGGCNFKVDTYRSEPGLASDVLIKHIEMFHVRSS